MLELTGVASILRGFHALYWLLAIVLLATAIYRPKSGIAKAIWTLIVIGAFGYLPTTSYIESSKRQKFAEEAWAYFKNKCANDAGEKIYQTVTGVKSVQVIKPLPPASHADVVNQYWYGDPYSDATPSRKRAEYIANTLVAVQSPITSETSGSGFAAVESPVYGESGNRVGYVRYSTDARRGELVKDSIEKPLSHFGLYWEDISKSEDREKWVAGSRLRIVDLSTNAVIAERVGFLIEAGFGSRAGARQPWSAARSRSNTCPSITGTYDDRMFLLRVLNPN